MARRPAPSAAPWWPLLGIAVAVAAASDVDKDACPAASVPDGGAPLLAVVGGLLVIGLAALIGEAVRNRSIRVSALLWYCAFFGLMVVGVTSWVVTYVELRKSLLDSTELLLQRVAEVVEAKVEADMAEGVALLGLAQDAISMGTIDLSGGPTFPSLPLHLLWLYNSRNSRSVSSFYLGTPLAPDRNIGFMGVKKNEAPGAGADGYSISYTFNHGEAVPEYIDCRARDRRNCSGYVCGSGGDFDCQKTCADGVAYPPTAQEYCFNNVDEGGFAYTTGFPVRYSPKAGGTLLPAAPDVVTTANSTSINPRRRPWWTEDDAPAFIDPYLFIGGEVGLSASDGAFGPDGAFVAALAVDYTTFTMRELLAKDAFRPTPNTVIFLVDAEGNVLGSSLDAAALNADVGRNCSATGGGDGECGVINAPNVTSGTSVVRQVVADVAGRYPDGLPEAAGRRAVLYSRERITVTAPVEEKKTGFRGLMILTLPLSDVLDDADRASMLSLVITVAVSLAVSVLLAAGVAVGFNPLRLLAAQMQLVAGMHLDGPAPPKPWAREVLAMQTSFDIMVVRLREYKEFIPHNLLESSGEDPDAAVTLAGLPDATDDDDDDDEADKVVPVSGAIIPLSGKPFSGGAHSISGLFGSQTSGLVVPNLTSESPDMPVSEITDDSSNGSVRPYLGQQHVETSMSVPSTPAWNVTSASSGPTHAPRAFPPNPLVTDVRDKEKDKGAEGGEVVSPPGLSPMLSDRPGSASKFMLKLVPRKVTVLMMRDMGFPELCGAQPETALAAHSQRAALALGTAKKHKGVVDRFDGDRIIISFNVHKQITSHRSYALACANDLRGSLQGSSVMQGGTIGISTGRAVAGTMGCSGLKQLNIVGEMADVCPIYARLAWMWGLRIVVGEAVLKDALRFEWRRLYEVVSQAGRRSFVCEILHEVEMGQDEWMYTLDKMSSSPYRHLDRAIEAVFAGQYRGAQEHLAAATAAKPPRCAASVEQHIRYAERWLQGLISVNAPRPEPLALYLQAASCPLAASHLAAADLPAKEPSILVDSVTSSMEGVSTVYASTASSALLPTIEHAGNGSVSAGSG
eukprot:TRINITY_DN1547_c1_g5_i1.p1 TRINITY_DN1547_c1_g5~~TRINITY_DN1547_c1_g5_i1.p1  ORF type:complete len:1095 (+),score=316.69 TRINITY_DN1547_c1_g5_i1:47-3286(+)